MYVMVIFVILTHDQIIILMGMIGLLTVRSCHNFVNINMASTEWQNKGLGILQRPLPLGSAGSVTRYIKQE